MAITAIDAYGGPTRRGILWQRWWTPLRVLILIGCTQLALAFLVKAPCLRTGEDGVSLDWSGQRQYLAACYSDILPLYQGRGLDVGGDPYAFSWVDNGVQRYMEYPVITGWFQGIMGWIARTMPFPGISPTVWYFTITAAVLATVWLLVIRAVVNLTKDRVWDTLLVAASPLVVIHAYTNWDILSNALAVGAILLNSKNRVILAGILIGLGTATKLWPLFLLGPYLVLALRNRQLLQWWTMVAGAAGAWLVVNVPVMVMHPESWAEFSRLNSSRGAEWTTIYQVLERTFHLEIGVNALNVISFVLFGVGCIAVAWLGLRYQASAEEMIFLVVTAFLLVNKVWSPQYSLWLVVFVALVYPRWRLILAWSLTECVLWFSTMWYMAEYLPATLFNLIILTRGALLIAIARGVIRQILRRERECPQQCSQLLSLA